MKDIVNHLREGWYGNGDIYCNSHPCTKYPVDCWKLWATCLAIAGTKFVPLCDGISGEIRSVIVDETFFDESVTLPIDTLIVDLTSEDNDDIDLGSIVNI